MPNSERSNKVVMGLGIATVVLLSANLIAVLVQRVWPKLQDLALVQSLTQTDEIAPAAETAWDAETVTIHIRRLPHEHTIVRLSPKISWQHRCRAPHFETELDTRLDIDLERLERDIERETSRIERELSHAGQSLGATIALRLQKESEVIALNRKTNLAELEEKMRQVSLEFEILVREHEAAAEKARIIMDESS